MTFYKVIGRILLIGGGVALAIGGVAMLSSYLPGEHDYDLIISMAYLFMGGMIAMILSYPFVKLGEMSNQEYDKMMDDLQERKERRIANNIPCPVCGSKDTKRISTANRATSIFVAGLASSKIGKQYECLNCKHKW